MISFLLTILGIIFFTIATIMLVISSFSIRKQQRLDHEALSLAEQALENFKRSHSNESENFKGLNAQVDKIRKDADQQIKKTENDLIALKKDYQSKIDELTEQSIKDKIVIEETQKQRDDLYQQLNRQKKNSPSQSLITSETPQKTEQSLNIKAAAKTSKVSETPSLDKSQPPAQSPAAAIDKNSISSDSGISQKAKEPAETKNTEALSPRSKPENIPSSETTSNPELSANNNQTDPQKTVTNNATKNKSPNQEGKLNQPATGVDFEILPNNNEGSSKTNNSQTVNNQDSERKEQPKDLPADKDKYLLSLIDDSANPEKDSQTLNQPDKKTDEKK
ncbi:MAG: hypothetical protein PHV17_05190 [Candidatus Omnitrophica bacterium]|nr:hypothetical protein [Candidatus Omnitrophota bacterium]